MMHSIAQSCHPLSRLQLVRTLSTVTAAAAVVEVQAAAATCLKTRHSEAEGARVVLHA